MDMARMYDRVPDLKDPHLFVRTGGHLARRNQLLIATHMSWHHATKGSMSYPRRVRNESLVINAD